jgi:hypothetical protein
MKEFNVCIDREGKMMSNPKEVEKITIEVMQENQKIVRYLDK